MQSLSKFNKGFKYLLCAIDLFSKYAWVIPIKDKKGTCIVNAFQKIISQGRKPNKIWVDQGSKFYNQSFKDFLKINNIEMYSTYNEGKSVVAERFMTTILKNVSIDSLNDIVNKYYNTVHKTIKMKPIDVTGDSYVEYNENFNKKSPKFKVNDHVRISKYKNISDLNSEKVIGTFYEKELQKANQKKCRTEKVLKRKGDKLYVKWKGYDSSFNSWINKKDII